ncbi:HlyD family efflux transporter periplasmic adaptor subunit [Rhodopirellula sp. JC740]|uniref:HlyD family efflux transporter periplasmic adaptor subunit n=1 Tax=Rhodopirellula halodulae TaxID=2894198 RepID=A0ABS8NHZ3_9BACT|nr:HlyD family efflux transporter periplasmic adaptor subunit [Rhodopirellula sp. JC740]MCC9643184.1 HlyD family efflux transporter periplasmic adaptor subunit [Rhodopirellula sp. JC740]
MEDVDVLSATVNDLRHATADATRDLGLDWQQRAETLATAIELQTALDGCQEFDDATAIATQSLCRWLKSEGAVLCWSRPGGRLRCVHDHASGGGQIAGGTERELLAAAEEACLREGVTHVGQSDVAAPPATMAMRQWLQAIGSSHLLACPLKEPDSTVRGVLMLVSANDRSAATVMDAFAPLLASKLQSIERLQPVGMEATIVRGMRSFRRVWQRTLVLVLSAVFLLMFLPAPHNIRTTVELQPVKRRFLSVPFDGPLQACLVRPGDMVEQGELLAKINPRELEFALAGLKAEANQADQERRGSMATHEFGKSRIAALEADRLKTQTDLLNYQKENLEIRSPIDGIILSGDWKQSEGAPLTRGETLFEIAPTGSMKVEIAISEEDIAHVAVGMLAQIHTHAMPERVMHGEIKRIQPTATIRESENVFLAEVEMDDQEGLLRPGMKGRAIIYGDQRPIGWIVFHRPWNQLLRWLGV